MKSIKKLFLIAFIAVCSSSFAVPQPGTLFGIDNELGKKLADSRLYTIDPSTGFPTLVGDIGFPNCFAFDFHPTTNVPFAVCFDDILAEQVLINIDPYNRAGKLCRSFGCT